MTIVREQKKRPLRFFCYVVENNFSFNKKKLIKFGDTLFGYSRS